MPDPIPCPVCGRPAIPQHRPFCSARCAQIDLGRWFSEQYHLPAEPAAVDDAAAPALDPAGDVG